MVVAVGGDHDSSRPAHDRPQRHNNPAEPRGLQLVFGLCLRPANPAQLLSAVLEGAQLPPFILHKVNHRSRSHRRPAHHQCQQRQSDADHPHDHQGRQEQHPRQGANQRRGGNFASVRAGLVPTVQNRLGQAPFGRFFYRREDAVNPAVHEATESGCGTLGHHVVQQVRQRVLRFGNFLLVICLNLGIGHLDSGASGCEKEQRTMWSRRD
uniref:(northern house mosquito) hypothetical protein n=1 Tax=Culex pipiens TaxID=7175 RepID=A0A8D8CYG1_CULPI